MLIHVDFETRSRIDLSDAGAYRYAEDHSTEILCVAWKINTLPTQVHVFDRPATSEFLQFVEALKRPDAIICAHNAEFEMSIFGSKAWRQRCGDFDVNPSKFRCTMAMALACGLPPSLGAVAAALRLSLAKDGEGKRLMLKMCKPDKNGQWVDSPVMRDRLAQYCKTDVDVETLIYDALPPLPPNEQKLWELTYKMNATGLMLDRPLCLRANADMVKYMDAQNARCVEMTGATGKQVAALKAFVNERGCSAETLDKDAVDALLRRTDISSEVREVLEIRQNIGQTAVAKLPKMLDMVCSDGRIRGNLKYHGASTGRWSGTGVQFQNLYRPTVKDTDNIIDALRVNLLFELYSSPAEAVASVIRGMIIPSGGRLFFDADYSAIEARIVAWIAGDEPALKAYRRGDDVYKAMASDIFNVPVDRVTSEQRHTGKTVELGSGYGLGAAKFFEKCQKDNIPMTEELAAHCINTYRAKHPSIVKFWYGVEEAARAAIRTENVPVRYADGRLGFKTVIGKGHKWLLIQLPNKRLLRYYNPVLKTVKTKVGDKVAIGFTGNFQGKPSDELLYGGLLTNNICQGIARDIMAGAMQTLDARGFSTVLTVHDEILCEAQKTNSDARFSEFIKIMETVPEWATGLPLKVGAWIGDRYRK